MTTLVMVTLGVSLIGSIFCAWVALAFGGAVLRTKALMRDLITLESSLDSLRGDVKRLNAKVSMQDWRQKQRAEAGNVVASVSLTSASEDLGMTDAPPPNITNEMIADRIKNGPAVPFDKPCPDHKRDPVGWLIWQQEDINRRREKVRK